MVLVNLNHVRRHLETVGVRELFRAVLLAAFLVSNSALAGEAASIEYELAWDVAKDGSAHKLYRFTYKGSELLKKLEAYSVNGDGGLEILSRVLPVIEEQDRLVSRKRLAPGVFEWEYEISAGPPISPESFRTRQYLAIFDPVVQDPLANPWTRHESSRYYFDSRALTITTRLTLNTPWNFKGGMPEYEHEVIAPGVKAAIRSKPLTGNPASIEITTRIAYAEQQKVSQKQITELQGKYMEWLMTRLQGTVLYNPKPESVNVANRLIWGWDLNFSGLTLPWNTYDSIGFSISADYMRTFTEWFYWRILAAKLQILLGLDSGSKQTTATSSDSLAEDLSVSSLPTYRFSRRIANETKRPITWFVDLFAGPEGHLTNLYDHYRSASYGGFSPAAVVGTRIGISNPASIGFAGFALGFRYSGYFTQSPAVSSWVVSLEFY